MPHISRRWIGLVLAACLLWLGGPSSPAYSQSPAAMQERVNQGIVTVMCGRSTGSFLYFCEDLAILLNDNVNYQLRLVPMIGEGSVRNIEDVLFLKGVDLGMAFADALDFMERQEVYADIKSKLRYVTSLYGAELHVLAREDIRSVKDLAGQKVNFSTPGTGTFLTMTNVFEALNIGVDVQSDAEQVALEKLKRGEIAALGFGAARPWKLVTALEPNSKLHLLDLPVSEITGPYDISSWTAKDYPQAIAKGDTIHTVRVPVVLLAYNWPADNPRCAKVQRFVDALRTNFPKLLKPPFQDKWHEVDLDREVPGLERWQKSC